MCLANENTYMNNQFDELTKGVSRSVTRRGALKKFGMGLVAAMAASLGVRSASAAPRKDGYCQVQPAIGGGAWSVTGQCVDPNTCQRAYSSQCPAGLPPGGSRNTKVVPDSCNPPLFLATQARCSF